MFKSVFRAVKRVINVVKRTIGTFISNLTRDPLGTLLVVASAISAFYTLGMAFALSAPGTIWNIGVSMWVAVGATLAVMAVGLDSDLMLSALAIFGFVMSVYALGVSGDPKLSIFSKFFGSTARLSEGYRIMLLGVSAFVTMGTLTSIRDGVTITEGLENAAGDVVGFATGIVTGAVGGFLDAALSSPFGIGLLIGGAILLTSGSSPVILSGQPQDNKEA
jgi:hypothetical protein